MRSMAFSGVKKFVARWRKELVGLVGVVSAVLFVLWWFGQVTFVKQEVTLVQILTGLLVLAGLYWTSRRVLAAEDHVRVAEEGHITDRFTQAIAQLGDQEMAIRLGGIYALERIAKDSEKDHGPIMEVLTAYVRENAPRQAEDPQTAPAPLPTDMQAILTVLGRRETTGKNRGTDRLDLNHTRLTRADLRGAELGGVNLYEADLRGADLSDANLRGADLTRAILGGVPLPPEAPQDDAFLLSPTNLTGVWPPQPVNPSAVNLRRANLSAANLGGANLSDAKLHDANLSGASLRAANLTWAELMGANLSGAELMAARLTWAILGDANLRGAELALAILYEDDLTEAELEVGIPPMGAMLSGAKNLTAKQVQVAQNWRHAQLPEDLQYLKDLPDPPTRSAESEPKGA